MPATRKCGGHPPLCFEVLRVWGRGRGERVPVVRRLGVLRGRTRRRVVVPGGARSYLRGAL